MDAELKERFIKNWNKYLPGADLPIGFYYTEVKIGKPCQKSQKATGVFSL